VADGPIRGRKGASAQGLGEGMAQALAAAGASVAVADVQDDLGAKVAESLGGRLVLPGAQRVPAVADGLIFQAAFAPLVARIRVELPLLRTLVCLDAQVGGALTWEEFLGRDEGIVDRDPVDDLAMIVGTGGTTGRPKGVLLTGTNLETMTAITLMSYPFDRRPVYLALAPLTQLAVGAGPTHPSGR
jgi:acyl-CoA synthetase (AMP-forming)/AMP-acid ligase II